ncbi:MAG: hypothetical protein VXZ72_02810 [Chlamydiota bacterium]|nr:hypothetical protein [Chlamydiota bacterium]
MRLLLCFLFFPLFLRAEIPFLPWYTGPLITPSALNEAKGQYNVQPYLFAQWEFGQYGDHMDRPHLFLVSPQVSFQTGLSSFLDLTIYLGGTYQKQRSISAMAWNDSQITFGFQILRERPFVPNVRFTLTESLPTGKYEHFSQERSAVEATGLGSYTTTLAFNFSKSSHLFSSHPLAWRGSISALLPTRGHYQGLSLYGGGEGMSAQIRPGYGFSASTSLECSLTQNWVVSWEWTYQQQGSAKWLEGSDVNHYSLDPSYLLTTCPGVEYNLSEHAGFLAGVLISILGKNQPKSLSLGVSFTYSW